MSNAVGSRGHGGRGKPNQGFLPDHNVSMDQQPQFAPVYVNPNQMNYPPRGMPPQPMTQHNYSAQQFGGPQQYNQGGYYAQPPGHEQSQPPPQHHQQQPPQAYFSGGNYNHNYNQQAQMYPQHGQQQYQYPPRQPMYQSDTVKYSIPPPPQGPPQGPPHGQPQGPPMQHPPVQQELTRRERKPLLIMDPNTKEAVSLPERQAPPPPPPVVQQIHPEDEKKKEDISREMREKVIQNLHNPHIQQVNDAKAQSDFSRPPPQFTNRPPPQVVATSTQPPAHIPASPQAAEVQQPKTPEAPAKAAEPAQQPEVVTTPVSSPQVAEVATPASDTAETASTTSEARVTPTLQKEESKEEVDDDKFDEEDRETPDVAETPAEKTAEELAAEKAQKDAEAAEKKKQLEATLEKKVEELVGGESVDVANGVFGRAFMTTIREIEKQFSRTPCPLSPQQLLDFGLDIKSMRVPEKKQNFTPTWMPNKGGGGGRPQAYRGRTTTDGTGRGAQQSRENRNHQKRPPVVRASIERVQRMALPTSKDAWKPDRQKAGDSIPEDEAAIKEVCKKVRALMNKVTPTSQVPLTQEFISYNVSSNDKQLEMVVGIVFDKAVEEPKFCALYAEICKAQVNHELAFKGNNGKSAFRNTVLTKTQTFFQDKRELDEKGAAIIAKEEDPVKKAALEVEEKQKFRRRKFGVMAFIGHLFRNQLLSNKIVQHCSLELFASVIPTKCPENKDKDLPLKKENIDEESVHCGLQLIETVGMMLDKSKDASSMFLDQWFAKLEDAKPLCSNKIRFMIMNLVELRKDRWVPRKSTESGPKKIDEIHKDIKQEKIENEKARDQYDRDRDRDRRHGGGVRPNSNSLRKQPPVSRNSLERNRTQHPDQKRAAAAANTKLQSSSVAPKNISLSAMDNNTSLGKIKKEWNSGASGGGHTSEAAPAPIKSAWGRRDSNDQRKKSTVDDKQSVLAAAREMGGLAGAARRSTSQTSIPDKVDEELTDEEKKARAGIMRTVKTDIEEVVAGDLPLKDFVESFSEFIGKEKYGKPSLVVVYEMMVRAVSEKDMKEEERKKLAHAFRMSLVSKTEKQAFIDGVTRFCKYAVDFEMFQDDPNLWSVTAEVLMNTMHVHHEVIEGQTPVENISLNEMGPAFLAAKTEGKKKYELFVKLIKRWTDDELAETQSVDALSWDFQELSFKDQMMNDGLREEMGKVEASNGSTLAELLFK